MYLILIPAALVLAVALFFILRAYRRGLIYRYYRFVDENSTALEEQRVINRTYVFPAVAPVLISHNYDNKITFQTVSCRDYLIYKLNYDPKFAEHFASLRHGTADKTVYDYREALANIRSFGVFKTDPGRLRRKRLLEIERERFDSRRKRPFAAPVCTVRLFRCTLSGRITGKKEETFPESEIFQILKRLKDKTGNRFNDREIWDALCRVERSRVTNKLRFEIYERDGYRCRNCGKGGGEKDLEIDHVYPVSKGGKSTRDNLQTLCRTCNLKKGNRV